MIRLLDTFSCDREKSSVGGARRGSKARNGQWKDEAVTTDFPIGCRVYVFGLARLGTVAGAIMPVAGADGYAVDLDPMDGTGGTVGCPGEHLLPLSAAAERPVCDFCLEGASA